MYGLDLNIGICHQYGLDLAQGLGQGEIEMWKIFIAKQ